MISSQNTSRAFTLIELLVVISIIGMLSSVVLVSLSSARDKGKLASVQTFEGTLYRSWGADAVAIFEFSDANASTLLNTSGNTGSLTCTGPADAVDPSTQSVANLTVSSMGKVLKLLAGVQCDNSSYNFTAAKFDATNGSISFWVFPTASFNNFNYIGHVAGNWININGSGQVVFAGVTSVKGLPQNKWSHVVISWYPAASTNNKLQIYIDGKLDRASDPGTLSFSGNLLRLGFTGETLTGYIDRFAIYNKSIQNP